MGAVKLQNWKRSIGYYASSVERVESVDDIVRIVKDRETYPSPVRVKGSHHSTTKCIVAEQGTVIDITGMNQILEIDRDAKTIKMEAGVLHIDAARELEKHGLQFYVNVEIGNLTVGSGACGGTKDASYFSQEQGDWEFGQVASYVVGMKVVLPDGKLMEVTVKDGELMEVMRSSYGMLGILYEVTYQVKEIKPLAVEHVQYHVDEFAERLDELIAQNCSMMLFLLPYLDTVIVEYRYDGTGPIRYNTWQWRLRNWFWKIGNPFFGQLLSTIVPLRELRSRILNAYNRLSGWVLTRVLRGSNTSPADQIIRYPETAGFASYTFSIWAFPREEYSQTLRQYFRFCKEYFRKNGYRCDLLNVGYHIAQDTRSLFSYTRQGPAITLDPVSTGGLGWDGFITAYNEFCIQHNGIPLFNQSPGLTSLQAKAAFGSEIDTFLRYRQYYDPEERFYTDYFRRLFE